MIPNQSIPHKCRKTVQLANFMGKVFTHFSKPTRRFIEECIYGIQASGDTKLSSIVRAIDDDIRPIYTEKKLSRNLNNDKLAEHLKHLSKRMGEIPEFAAYSIADGLKRAFTRFGKWIRTFGKTNAIDASATNGPMLPGFAEFFELDYG